jgi:hypothetical protein
MRSTKPLRLAAGVVAVAASAALWLVYMANGIGYGSLIGLKGREHDVQIMASRETTAVIVAVISQMLAWIMLVSALRPTDGTSPWTKLKPWVIAVSVSFIGTLGFMTLFFVPESHV